MHMELTHPCGATPSGVLAAVPSAPAALQASWGCDLGPQRASARHPTWGQRLPHGLCPLRQRKGLGTPAQGLHSLPSLPWLQRVGSRGQAAFTIPGPHNPSAQSSRLRLLQPRKSRSHTTSLAVGSWRAQQDPQGPRDMLCLETCTATHAWEGWMMGTKHPPFSLPLPSLLIPVLKGKGKRLVMGERVESAPLVHVGQHISVQGSEGAAPAPQAGQERWTSQSTEDSKAPEPAPIPGTAESPLPAAPLLRWSSGSLKKGSGKVTGVRAKLWANTLSPQMSAAGCEGMLRAQGRAGARGCVIGFQETCLCVWSGSARPRPSSLCL